jgi:hypothetical protein
MMQIEQGLRQMGKTGRVYHVVDMLDEAYRAEELRGADNLGETGETIEG